MAEWDGDAPPRRGISANCRENRDRPNRTHVCTGCDCHCHHVVIPPGFRTMYERRKEARPMPIRPEQKDRYPKDWREISLRIRAERANWRCECRGECGNDHRYTDPLTSMVRSRCAARNAQPHPVTGSLVVLTVAHLDHQPEHCEPDNLRAMCQRCHLAYDADHHAQTKAAAQRKELALTMEPLFVEPVTGDALGESP
jgi:hypothetical protein